MKKKAKNISFQRFLPIILLSAIILVAFFFALIKSEYDSSRFKNEDNRSRDKAVQIPKSEAQQKTNDSWDWSQATKPEIGRLYLTADQNGQGIYVKNNSADSSVKFQPGTTPYKGLFYGFNGHATDGYFHFLKDPKPFKHEITVDHIRQLKYAGNNHVYAFLADITADNSNNEDLYQLNTNDLTIRKIWKNIFRSDTSNVKGASNMDEVVDDAYIVLSIYSCLDCEGELLGKVVININTGKYLYLKDISNLTVNTLSKNFTYQELYPFKEKCGPPDNPYCDSDGTITIKKPSGQLYTMELP